ncbi:hypothetical protein KC332_g83 [Hortaea werneckii]|nr:hypothetical protein KC348_g90 [Hortaea werneckii]KAI7421927.1 hypothetical protein KC332_g83 [Hortaea werneckii]
MLRETVADGAQVEGEEGKAGGLLRGTLIAKEVSIYHQLKTIEDNGGNDLNRRLMALTIALGGDLAEVPERARNSARSPHLR